ncbi:RhuM family protein [Rhodoferax sp.]|uniref:RhuM family protein n=1 Tax=Rhodoferax sp. TaxID=50421 RepID=UPI002725E9EC|nr:RhuM family protein [Rhodoferax sp.]MDO9146052.1 RhuM family protein [Rhodoferax sp.]MDP3191607.1 RhuM family protein [Rhodoferax sp.]MDP3864764.1 RhuM family protein [Rhodoferax sp.]
MAQSGRDWHAVQTTPQNITQHFKAIYAEGEADPETTCKSGLQVRQEAGRQVRRTVRHYSLEVILAVGYRARSARGTQFRQWATAHLSEYLLKGFVMDDERLKNPPVGESALPDRFGELLERIRDIRASERRMYLRVALLSCRQHKRSIHLMLKYFVSGNQGSLPRCLHGEWPRHST